MAFSKAAVTLGGDGGVDGPLISRGLNKRVSSGGVSGVFAPLLCGVRGPGPKNKDVN